MPPHNIHARAGRGRAGLAALVAIAAGAATLLPGAAQAIVGGDADAGDLGRASVMVLSSHGGVCTGIVLAPDAILTAAHCASGASDFRVHYRDANGEPVLITPAQRSVHTGYDAAALAKRRRSIDLALIRLPAPLPELFKAAALSDVGPTTGTALTVGGYGVAREGDGRSTGTFRTAPLSDIEPYGRSHILVWATGAGGAASGACEGDSGGPIADAAGIVAVTTWASGKGRHACGDVTQGVLVGPQRSWIDRILAGWGRAAAWR